MIKLLIALPVNVFLGFLAAFIWIFATYMFLKHGHLYKGYELFAYFERDLSFYLQVGKELITL